MIMAKGLKKQRLDWRLLIPIYLPTLILAIAFIVHISGEEKIPEPALGSVRYKDGQLQHRTEYVGLLDDTYGRWTCLGHRAIGPDNANWRAEKSLQTDE